MAKFVPANAAAEKKQGSTSSKPGKAGKKGSMPMKGKMPMKKCQ